MLCCLTSGILSPFSLKRAVFDRFGRILSSPFTVPLRQKDDIILNSISLTSQNNKISDTTKKQQQQQNVHTITGVRAGTLQRRAPITAGATHRS